MRDMGSSGCVVRKSITSRAKYTGRTINCKLMDGSELPCLAVEVYVESPYFNGWTRAAIMENPVCDFVVGNIPGAMKFYDGYSGNFVRNKKWVPPVRIANVDKLIHCEKPLTGTRSPEMLEVIQVVRQRFRQTYGRTRVGGGECVCK